MSLVTNIQDLVVRIATEMKALRTLVNGNALDNSALLTTHKGNLVGAINELKGAVDSAAQSGGASINDNTIASNTTWSSTKINSTIDSDISAAVASLVNGAPTTMDTLKELSDALAAAEESGEIATIMTELGNRVRFDAVQTLTDPQKAQARTNIGAGTSNLVIGTTASTAKAGDYTPANATTGATGLVQLAGDLGGTATAPTVRAATETVAGKVELATSAEATTGTDTTRAVHPAGLKAVADTKAPTVHTHTASQISDASTTGRTVLTGTAAQARTAIDAASATDVGDTAFNFVAAFEAGL